MTDVADQFGRTVADALAFLEQADVVLIAMRATLDWPAVYLSIAPACVRPGARRLPADRPAAIRMAASDPAAGARVTRGDRPHAGTGGDRTMTTRNFTNENQNDISIIVSAGGRDVMITISGPSSQIGLVLTRQEALELGTAIAQEIVKPMRRDPALHAATGFQSPSDHGG